jgi:hypothetical protein
MDELPVRCSAQRLGEDAAVRAGLQRIHIGTKIVIVREQRIQERSPGNRIRVYVGRTGPTRTLFGAGRGRELDVAVRTRRSTTEVAVPYTVTGKGRLTTVAQSSQWLPMSVPPAVIVPVTVVVEYPGAQVGDGDAVGVGVGVLVGVTAGVGVGEG